MVELDFSSVGKYVMEMSRKSPPSMTKGGIDISLVGSVLFPFLGLDIVLLDCCVD